MDRRTEEADKLRFSSSSPTQPLLSSPPPSPLYPPPPFEDPSEAGRPESDPTEYVQISYNYGHRPVKDLPFLLLFILFVLSTFGFGIFAIFNRNTNFSNLSSYVYDASSTSCVKNDSLSLSTLPPLSGPPSLSSSSEFSDALIWTLVITFLLSIPICILLLLLLKRYTKQIVYASLPFFVLIPIFFDVYWFVACTVSSSCSEDFPLVYRILVLVFILLIIGIIAWVIVANWHRIELTMRIIAIASDALWWNSGLLWVIASMTIGLVVYYVPIVVFLIYARSNGKIVPDEESDGDYSCVWKQDGWVPAYFALAILTMLWSAAVMVEAQVYVISGTIAQWYFSKVDAFPKQRSIRTSLRNAFGPSAGTICLSGLLLGAVHVVRAIVESARQEDAHGMVNLILRCCVNVFLAAIDFLNKFTINLAAITGEAYCSSARMSYDLLKRNLLSAVFVETISTRLLTGIIFVLSALFAVAAWAILKGVGSLGADSYFVAVLAWLILILILGFFVHVLENVINAVYVCYAIDRDRGEVCKQDVHDVYVHLPISRNHAPSLLTGSLVV